MEPTQPINTTPSCKPTQGSKHTQYQNPPKSVLVQILVRLQFVQARICLGPGKKCTNWCIVLLCITLYSYFGAIWDQLGPFGTIWDDLGQFGTIGNHLGQLGHWIFGLSGTIGDHLGPVWVHLGPFGTHLGPFGTI